ncbi:MAG: hypothetical protein ABIU09_05985 [Pyrinomonadaceae bacterium]
MRATLFTIFLTLFTGMTTIAAAQKPGKLILRVAQEKTAPGTAIKIKFLNVPEDSRCPTGVNCIWAGVAKIKLQLRKNGKRAEFELNTNQLDKSITFEGNEINLTALTPYPKSGTAIKPAAYTATLSITKLVV